MRREVVAEACHGAGVDGQGEAEAEAEGEAVVGRMLL